MTDMPQFVALIYDKSQRKDCLWTETTVLAQNAQNTTEAPGPGHPEHLRCNCPTQPQTANSPKTCQ